jgi:hypothetical protein
MSEKDLLIEALGLIVNKTSWMRGRSLALDAEDNPIRPQDIRACRWSAIGAVLHVGHREALDLETICDAVALLHRVAKKLGYPCAHSLNDAAQSSHANVLAMMQKAIQNV